MFGSLDNYLASPIVLRFELHIVHFTCDDTYLPFYEQIFDRSTNSLTLIKVKVRSL